MKHALIALFVTLLLAACGNDNTNPVRPGGNNPGANGSYQPPQNSRWSATEYSNAVNSCTNATVQYYQQDRQRSVNYCICDYNYAAVQWTYADFSGANFNTYWGQMSNVDAGCKNQAGVNF